MRGKKEFSTCQGHRACPERDQDYRCASMQQAGCFVTVQTWGFKHYANIELKPIVNTENVKIRIQ